MQNYPNPFNPETEISFSVPERSNVIIRIYNSTGEETVTLTDRITPAGYHRLIWNASEFPSGIYYYQMLTDKFTITKKMVLIK
ncbi:MAG TPA: T9SS type A sorting domain-containing protein [Ignavibacteria bacterium]|nr:hypothetical protein [Bacteroidota bacterium]HRE11465.1 T9SS type A sorting domain-containing protein [Ignavibacteria bacterium]HRF65607.1 T9SS type A sorting domain-containing protein [Ignavibacteria bacterium]HRJ03361.1 T9SS type A sorting domain-containing protein [Ignavibacteria bacterium]HRJ86518.1 T9SS type A sorting domain-containing protein [Ignavibacteria bacterium]